VRLFSEVTGVNAINRTVSYQLRASGQEENLQADVIINAAGPWSGQVVGMAGLPLPVQPSAGAMVTIDRRVCDMVLNLLAPPGDGDIIVPQRGTSILGTTSWNVEEAGDIIVPPEHIEQIFLVAEKLVPDVRKAKIRGIMAAARPLLVVPGSQGRQSTRGFACYDHSSQGAPGLFSIVGGKTTTARLMAENMSDLVCRFLEIERPCRTSETPLASHRKWLS
jgi:glycerol-3-phosphate dehydrogenase